MFFCGTSTASTCRYLLKLHKYTRTSKDMKEEATGKRSLGVEGALSFLSIPILRRLRGYCTELKFMESTSPPASRSLAAAVFLAYTCHSLAKRVGCVLHSL